MTLFVVSVALVLIVSAICSLSEAALYSVRMPYVRQLVEEGARAGMILDEFKRNMDRPITAILILNTVSNTAGAAVAGAQARLLFGETALLWFSVVFTLAVLMFSEIMPKIAGVTYRRAVSRLVAVPLHFVIRLLSPLVWLSRHVARLLGSAGNEPMAPETDVHHLASLSAEEGSILPIEAKLVRNALQLDDVTARAIMTPRTVMFTLAAERTVGDVSDVVTVSAHSRIPIFADSNMDKLSGWVLKSDILTRLVAGDFDAPLSDLAKPIRFVPETAPGHQLLRAFLRRRTHILGVVDEYGGVAGIVTMEDVLESLLGEEIVDETDAVVDFQASAREQGRSRLAEAGDQGPIAEDERSGQGMIDPAPRVDGKEGP